MKINKLGKIIHDVADAESSCAEKSVKYLKSMGVDVDSFISKGLKKINQKSDKQPLSKSKSHFARIVLAAEIAYRCHNQITFGSVKFQKLLFLCENVSKMQIRTSYVKQAAGPFDNKFMHTIAKEFKRLDWFKVEKVTKGKFAKVNYTPLEGVGKYKKYYKDYFLEEDRKIQYILNLFEGSKTREVELIATLYACWQEQLRSSSIFSNEKITQLFYNWAPEKRKFTEIEIHNGIIWMKEKEVYPKS